MTHDGFTERRPALQHDERVDAAKQRALQLRTEAINAFWSDLAGALRRAWHARRRDGVASGRAAGASPCPR